MYLDISCKMRHTYSPSHEIVFTFLGYFLVLRQIRGDHILTFLISAFLNYAVEYFQQVSLHEHNGEVWSALGERRRRFQPKSPRLIYYFTRPLFPSAKLFAKGLFSIPASSLFTSKPQSNFYIIYTYKNNFQLL